MNKPSTLRRPWVQPRYSLRPLAVSSKNKAHNQAYQGPLRVDIGVPGKLIIVPDVLPTSSPRP